jgi:hypothetical protein
METAERSRRIRILRVGLLTVLAITGAVFAYRHMADASSEGPIPAAKRAHMDTDAARRKQARAPKVADPSVARPSPGAVAWEEGIMADDESPSRDYLVRNRWGGTVQGRQVVVFAGASASDATRGVVLVQVVSADGGSSPPRAFDTPSASGAVHVVAAHGSRLTLAADEGARFVFNVATLRFE